MNEITKNQDKVGKLILNQKLRTKFLRIEIYYMLTDSMYLTKSNASL